MSFTVYGEHPGTRASGHRVEVVEGFARQARERPGRGIDLILPFSRRKALELIEECRLPSPGQQPHIARLHLGCKRLRPDLFRTGNPVGIDQEPRQGSDRRLDALLAATARLARSYAPAYRCAVRFSVFRCPFPQVVFSDTRYWQLRSQKLARGAISAEEAQGHRLGGSSATFRGAQEPLRGRAGYMNPA